MLSAMMLTTGCANRLMLRAYRTAINMAGNNMGGAVASPAVATGAEVAGGTVDLAAGGALT